MALGVDGMRAGKVVRKVIFLTLGTAIFIFCLTLLYESMRAVMDVGGACASGGAYEIRRPCPKGVGWVDAGLDLRHVLVAGIFTFLGVFAEGGPRPYVFAWSALFLALGWNFLDYGFDPPGGGTVGGLADLRLRVRGHGRRAAALPALTRGRALVAVGPRLAARRRLPPPVQAAARAHRRRTTAAHGVRTPSTPFAARRRCAARRHRVARSTPLPTVARARPAPRPPSPGDPSTPKGDVVEQLSHAGRPARARHARRRRVREGEERGARRGDVVTTHVRVILLAAPGGRDRGRHLARRRRLERRVVVSGRRCSHALRTRHRPATRAVVGGRGARPVRRRARLRRRVGLRPLPADVRRGPG